MGIYAYTSIYVNASSYLCIHQYLYIYIHIYIGFTLLVSNDGYLYTEPVLYAKENAQYKTVSP
jgi:hypothetical protein